MDTLPFLGLVKSLKGRSVLFYIVTLPYLKLFKRFRRCQHINTHTVDKDTLCVFIEEHVDYHVISCVWQCKHCSRYVNSFNIEPGYSKRYSNQVGINTVITDIDILVLTNPNNALYITPEEYREICLEHTL